MEMKLSKSNQPFLSYQPTSIGHSTHLGQMAVAAYLVNQKGHVRFRKIIFPGVSIYNQKFCEVELGRCYDQNICLINDPVCLGHFIHCIGIMFFFTVLQGIF